MENNYLVVYQKKLGLIKFVADYLKNSSNISITDFNLNIYQDGHRRKYKRFTENRYLHS
jgi:hypothetical protein